MIEKNREYYINSNDEYEVGQVPLEDAENLEKVWLFKESIRLETRMKEIEEKEEAFQRERREFELSVKQIRSEIDFQKRRLKEDEMFFEKKRAILENAFRQLDVDRKALEKERSRLNAEKSYLEEESSIYAADGSARYFFSGVNSILALKKRYKDLLRIFHPDNLCGDTNTVQIINREYENLKQSMSMERQA